MHRIKWLLVEWEEREGISPHYGLINVRSLLTRNVVLHTGKLVVVGNADGSHRRAKIVISSDDRRFLAQQLISMQEHSQEIEAAYRRAAMNGIHNTPVTTQQMPNEMYRAANEPRRYSGSLSSWSYSDSDSEVHTTRHLETNRGRGFDENVCQPAYNGQNLYRRNETNGSQTTSLPIIPKAESTPMVNGRSNDKHFNIGMTYDQGTQTVDSALNKKNTEDVIKRLDANGSVLELVIGEMEEKLNKLQLVVDHWSKNNGEESKTIQAQELFDDNCFDGLKDSASAAVKVETKNEKVCNNEKNLGYVNHATDVIKRKSSFDNKSLNRLSKRKSLTNNAADDAESETNDMMPIGTGKAYVPRQLFNQIDWNSHTIATRRLLMALFPRRTLATHSLTGKSSPAFMNKPAKNCLDPDVVNDIVMTVTANCGVKENLVRSAITTKLADENKMYRMRQEKSGKRFTNNSEIQKTDQENIPPTQNLKEDLE